MVSRQAYGRGRNHAQCHCQVAPGFPHEHWQIAALRRLGSWRRRRGGARATSHGACVTPTYVWIRRCCTWRRSRSCEAWRCGLTKPRSVACEAVPPRGAIAGWATYTPLLVVRSLMNFCKVSTDRHLVHFQQLPCLDFRFPFSQNFRSPLSGFWFRGAARLGFWECLSAVHMLVSLRARHPRCSGPHLRDCPVTRS